MAIIDVDGLLLNENLVGIGSVGMNPVAAFREKLDAAAADPEVCGVVLRINSIGGGVTASDLMWQEVRRFRAETHRPVVACLLDLGTGGCLLFRVGADQIVATPNTITGGIGVIFNSYNLRDTMSAQSVVPQFVKAGANIDMGTSASALTAQTRGMLQAMAEQFHQRFQSVVRQGRPNLPAGDGTTFDGRVFTAAQALERGLIDRIGYLEDAVAVARALAHQELARVVILHPRNSPACSVYATTPNTPTQTTFWPINVPGIERSRLPTFLYVWQPEPTLQRIDGR